MSASNFPAAGLVGLQSRAGAASGAMARPGRVLLITNQFPPNHGGSASVYAALAQHGGGRVVVLTPSLDYRDGNEIAGWRAHDHAARGEVRRVRLLRTLLSPAADGLPGRIRGWVTDLVLRLVVLARVVLLLHSERISAVCIGEVLASDRVIQRGTGEGWDPRPDA